MCVCVRESERERERHTHGVSEDRWQMEKILKIEHLHFWLEINGGNKENRQSNQRRKSFNISFLISISRQVCYLL